MRRPKDRAAASLAVMRTLVTGLFTGLMVACGGPGPGSDAADGQWEALHAAAPPPRTASGTPAADLEPDRTVESDPETQMADTQAMADSLTAERDLGLVDWDRGVRIATAAGDAGPLDPAQFRTAMLDTSDSVRRAAVAGLESHPQQARNAFLPDLALALDDPEQAVRESVVELLTGIDDPRALALLRRASRDRSPLVRDEAAAGLAARGVEMPPWAANHD